MTEKVKQMIDRKLQDSIDEWHDYFLTLHEMGYNVDPMDYVKYIYPNITIKMEQMREDLADEFDEEE